MKLLYVIYFQYVFVLAFSQNVEVYNVSSFKHDYLVTDIQYLEDIKDTNRVKFIASLKITGKHHDEIIWQWHNLISVNAKRLGANLFCVENYLEDEAEATLVIKLFFASENFIKVNAGKANKNTIYVFNQKRTKNDSAHFYLNKKEVVFDSKRYYTINTQPFQLYSVGLTVSKSTNKNSSFPKEKPSIFYMLPKDKKDLVLTNFPNPKGGIYLNFKKNKPLECEYSLGRFLLVIYK